MMKRIGLLVLYLAICIAACLVYFELRNRFLPTVDIEGNVDWIITIAISAGIGFALGIWRRANPWYVYVVAVLICLVTRWMAYFTLGFTCDYILKHCT